MGTCDNILKKRGVYYIVFDCYITDMHISKEIGISSWDYKCLMQKDFKGFLDEYGSVAFKSKRSAQKALDYLNARKLMESLVEKSAGKEK